MAGPTSTIALKLPSKYSSATSDSAAPTIDWLSRSWTVTHSTLSMWRAARNVRITYKPLPPKADGRLRIDDLVEYEPSDKDTALKSVAGIDTQSPGGWDWRGKGWLFFVGSHWELLGWGEEALADGRTERWAVTWFAPTLFTKEGLDIYSDQREGLSEATYGKIDQALRGLDAKALVDMVAQDMRPVEIKLPWAQK
ncbi:uncharacterized protein TRIVIDRAFT_38889 [Trichoderma virens Gv29-8]|uniref:Histidinolphosphatase-like protein n=1 Tax=Hypocrea virens (strain Gv29-8 / FGSC 10586) TaxID=413071 RepID=G9NCV4_HYPVG|nr:uncharacterized protein TRIVIDRAFT_38889 [Trichoderma virens Gv29-8]EHK15526.1 hypothetical protein TRIVIDRAFT_38889 [Trichoderma virens Gv29-8]